MDYRTVYATVTAPWGEVHSDILVGSMEGWAWDDKGARAPWLKVRRALILSEFTCDPKAPGWRVEFRGVADEDEGAA